MQHETHAGEHVAGPIDPSKAGALLGWWRSAGVDTLVSETPRSWLAIDAYVQNSLPAFAVPQGGVPQSAVPAQPARAQTSQKPFAADSLADLLAQVRMEIPHAPIADGNPASGIMILGEAPSAEDLRTGRPFTGPAGVLLDQMLGAIGLDRTNCYISLLAPRRHIPGPPPPEAIAADLELTRAHIRLAAPRLLLLLGTAASQTLTGSSESMSALRGHWQIHQTGSGEIPALPTFNPAYLFQKPAAKRDVWSDLLAFKRRMHA